MYNHNLPKIIYVSKLLLNTNRILVLPSKLASVEQWLEVRGSNLFGGGINFFEYMYLKMDSMNIVF